MNRGRDAAPSHRLRPPVLHPGPVPRAWSTSAWRLLVDERGALVLQGPKGPRVLAEPRTIEKVELVPAGTRVGRRRVPDHGPCVLLHRSGSSPLALPLLDWSPGQLGLRETPSGRRLAELLDLGGFRSLLTALGHRDAWAFELDEPDAEALRQLPPAQVVAPEHEGAFYARWAPRVGVAFAATFALAGIAGILGAGSTPLRIQNALGQVALAACFFAGGALLLRARRRALRPIDGAVDATSGLPGGVQVATLPGGDLAFTDPLGNETALPGPATGGVAVAVAQVQQGVGLRLLRLHGDDGAGGADLTPYDALDASWWSYDQAASDEVRRVVQAAGLRWQEVRTPKNAPRTPPLDRRRLPDPRWDAEVLRPVTPSAIIGALAGVLVARDGGVLGTAAGALSGVLVVSLAALWLLRLRDLRS